MRHQCGSAARFSPRCHNLVSIRLRYHACCLRAPEVRQNFFSLHAQPLVELRAIAQQLGCQAQRSHVPTCILLPVCPAAINACNKAHCAMHLDCGLACSACDPLLVTESSSGLKPEPSLDTEYPPTPPVATDATPYSATSFPAPQKASAVIAGAGACLFLTLKRACCCELALSQAAMSRCF